MMISGICKSQLRPFEYAFRRGVSLFKRAYIRAKRVMADKPPPHYFSADDGRLDMDNAERCVAPFSLLRRA